MTIKVIRVDERSIRIVVDREDLAEFKELVHRATNLWPDASPTIKAFADDITHDGKQMQDYTKIAVTQQPKWCMEIDSHCRRGCKGASCAIRRLDPLRNQP